ncbi:MAG: type domain [Cyanobacteria bacterium RYN_339]|nr:type domain [Cyanobacteria bacterium RYN_339]
MRVKLRWVLLPALGLAACALPDNPSPRSDVAAAIARAGLPPDGQPYSYHLLAVAHLPVVAVTADSAAAGLPKENATDGNLTTPWSNAPANSASAFVAVQLAATTSLGGVSLKTGALPAGVNYDLQVSTTGTTWTTVLAHQTNATWLEEHKAFPAGTTGKYVRVLWHNNPASPTPHFAVYELEVEAPGGASPAPGASQSPGASPSPGVSPSPADTPEPGETPSTSPSASPSGLEVKPLIASASSSAAATPPTLAIDADGATAWSNGPAGEKEAWLALKFPAATAFGHLTVKTGPQPAGVSYKVEVSATGTTWTAVSGNLTNTTWLAETKAVAGSGQFVRLHFFNAATSPSTHFAVYDVHLFK